MKFTSGGWTAIIVGLLFLLVSAGERGDAEEPAPKKKDEPFARLIGKKAPELVGVFGINGRAVKLSELRGKVVLIDFWAVWCGPCQATFPHLNGWHKEFHDDGLEVIGVTTYYKMFDFDKKAGKLTLVGKQVEDPKTGKVEVVGGLDQGQEHDMLRAFTGQHKLRYRIITLSKEDFLKSGKEYGREIVPHAVLVDRLGVIRLIVPGVSEEGKEALAQEIRKLIAER